MSNLDIKFRTVLKSCQLKWPISVTIYKDKKSSGAFISITVAVSSSLSYRKTSNISHTLVVNKIVDHSDVVGASPVGAAPTTSLFST